jgi:hypothetical protein
MRSCVVSYQDNQGIRHSVEVMADTLYEAAVLGLKALDANQRFTHNVTIDVRVKNPETTHSITGAVLEAWLARPAKNEKEQALKTRSKEVMKV